MSRTLAMFMRIPEGRTGEIITNICKMVIL